MNEKDNKIQELTPDIYVDLETDNKENEQDTSTLSTLIENKDVEGLKKFVDETDPIDTASFLIDIDDDDSLVFFFKVIPSDYSAFVFSYLDNEQQTKIVNAFSKAQLTDIISKMPNDDVTDFIAELPSNLVNKVLSVTSKEDREHINELLNYQKDTAGSIMTTEYVSLKKSFTVDQALNHIHRYAKEAETIETVYVIDETRKLLGSVSIKDIFSHEKEETIETFMNADCLSVISSTDQEEVAQLIRKYDLFVIPVVDQNSRLLGIITIDDVIDVIEKEQNEDLAHMSGITANKSEKPYLKTSVFVLAGRRLPWLLVLMISGTFTGLVLNGFEASLAVLPILTVFIPMLMDTGGNAGGQTTAVVTRALALGQISIRSYLKVLFKEFRVSLIVGFCLSIVNFLWIYFELAVGIISYNPAENSNDPIWLIAMLVALTSFFIVVLSKVLGASLPILAKAIHIDPAIMSGPIITTIVDVCALIIYFVMASSILSI